MYLIYIQLVCIYIESDVEQDPVDRGVASRHVVDLEAKILPSDIPQAFTHWTYVFTNRKSMVCDLQGELTIVDHKPIFKFTDPCIHNMKHCGGKKYGRTNMGHKGSQSFFKSHKCNAMCEILGLARSRR